MSALRAGAVLCKPSARVLKRWAGVAGSEARVAAASSPPLSNSLTFTPAPTQPTPSGYLLPAETAASVPFAVDRTALGKQLPVYTEFRHGRTKVLTQVRRYRGDVAALRSELAVLTQGARITQKQGAIEIEGDVSRQVKTWLAGLGF